MSTAIVRHDPTISSLEDVRRVALMLAQSNYFDAKAAQGDTAIAQLATKILAGREMGYGPFASVQGIHVIQGKPVISANLMAAAVKRSGRYDYRVRKLDNDGCEVEFFQRTGDKWESLGKSAFTRDDAKAAGLLGKDNWSKFARNMFFARALSNGIRWFAADVFDGSAAYTPDELGVTEDANGNAVIDVQPHVITQEAQPQSTPPAATVTTTGNGGAGNGRKTNGNGAPGAFGNVQTTRWPDANAAYAWAIEAGACENTHEARGSLKKIVDAQFGGRLTGDNMAAAFDAFHARQMEKLHEKAEAAVKDAPELNPDSEPLEVPA